MNINDQEEMNYMYRVSLSKIRAMNITNDLESIHQFDHRTVYPSPFPLFPEYNPNIQFNHDFPKKIQPGSFHFV